MKKSLLKKLSLMIAAMMCCFTVITYAQEALPEEYGYAETTEAISVDETITESVDMSEVVTEYIPEPVSETIPEIVSEEPEQVLQEYQDVSGWETLEVLYAADAGWQFDDTGWWYRNPDGSYPVSDWLMSGSDWYYFNSDGYMATGWVYVDGLWYYLNEDGCMQTGWLWDDAWYYLSPQGCMQTGWVWDGFHWYHMNDSGIMQTGWIFDGSDWYYLGEDGSAQTGWLWDDAWYYLNEDGCMQAGWVWDGYDWYHMSDSGIMQTGWILDGSDWYYLESNGSMCIGWLWDNAWYYFLDSGKMALGWLWNSGNLYYFNDLGMMTTGTVTIDGEVLDIPADGAVPLSTGQVLEPVMELQQMLADLGYLDQAPDGIYNEQTKEAVLAFQLANGVGFSGLPNEATINKLNTSPLSAGTAPALQESNTLTVEQCGNDSSRLLLRWTEVPGADGYYVFKGSAQNEDYQLINITETACKYIDKDLQPATSYSYFVVAYVGSPFVSASDKSYIAVSNTASQTTPDYVESYIWENTDVEPHIGNTVYVTSATDEAALDIYHRLEAGSNFYLFVNNYDGGAAYGVFYELKNKVRNMNDAGIGFVSLETFADNGGYYFLLDAETYQYMKQYILMAYKERMEEYGIYLENQGNVDYFYEHQNETTSDYDFIAEYRDSLFETQYGTPFTSMSSESRFLFTTPGTNMVVRANYMVFDLDYNTVGESAIDIIMKMANKSAIGVCRHFALAVKTICDYLGIPCWTPVSGQYNHQWAIVQTYSNTGAIEYYLVDNQNVVALPNEYPLKYRPVNDMIWDYTVATKAEMGDDYPF